MDRALGRCGKWCECDSECLGATLIRRLVREFRLVLGQHWCHIPRGAECRDARVPVAARPGGMVRYPVGGIRWCVVRLACPVVRGRDALQNQPHGRGHKRGNRTRGNTRRGKNSHDRCASCGRWSANGTNRATPKPGSRKTAAQEGKKGSNLNI